MTITTLQITVHELCECEDISESLLVAAVEHEIVAPAEGEGASDWVFDATHVVWLRKAIHLHRDLDLDWVAIAMVIDLLREREQLDQENQLLKQRLQRFLHDD
ncbi:MAG: chaperone modulatory protein CbpM [Glaciecola sp.]|jgi:chaperone modulatory protein CbpM|uniref:chaperone modulator CbpM n=1 Tax=Congregibacter sp. TaxID=2744308 RepID=UPI0039E6BFC0